LVSLLVSIAALLRPGQHSVVPGRVLRGENVQIHLLTDARRKLFRLSTFLAATALVGVACASPGASSAPPASAATSDSPASEAPASAPAKALRIGYISGGDSDPFVLLVTEGLRTEAEVAGVELSECDSAFEAEKALTCARTLAAQELDSMINWQFFPDSSEAVCEAYGGLPTVAIDTPEEPCQETFVGANNRQAGLVAGKGMGDFASEKFGCAYDAYITLDFPTIADINAARAGGSVEGFEGVCGPIPAEKYFSVDTFAGGPDQPENSRRQVTDILTTLPDARTILIISPSGDGMGSAALAAAEVAGRKDQVWITTHGADPSVREAIRSEPQWVGSVAYFPERYGALVMPLAIALANGETVAEEVLVEHLFINAENIDDFYPAG
jgi:ribose transport system substrate-binding protein